VDEWLCIFDDPILGNSALDRIANASYLIVIEGNSYHALPSNQGSGLPAKYNLDICHVIALPGWVNYLGLAESMTEEIETCPVSSRTAVS